MILSRYCLLDLERAAVSSINSHLQLNSVLSQMLLQEDDVIHVLVPVHGDAALDVVLSGHEGSH